MSFSTTGMKTIIIGMDRKLFEEGSAVLSRYKSYAEKMEELHVIVFSTRKHNLESKQIGNLYIYPTQSKFRLLYMWDAYKIAKQIVANHKLVKGNTVVSAQDPFECGLGAYLICKKFGFPMHLQIHTDFFSGHFKNSPLNFIRPLIARFLIPQADGLRVVSQRLAGALKNRFPRLKVIPEVLPILVDVEMIVNTQPIKNLKGDFSQFNFLIFMASRLTHEKRIDIALRVIKKLIPKSLSQIPFISGRKL